MNGLHDWLMLVGGVCFMLIPLPMMVVTWLYVNKTPRKQRLIELGYGTNNDWYRGKWIGFVDANYIFALMPGIAYGMKFRKETLKKPIAHMGLAPNLELNGNYNHLIKEFKFFTHWVLTCFSFIIFGMLILTIDTAISKGWFNL